jgi:hypothetical protein
MNETIETVWDRTTVGRYKIPESKLIRNSRSPKYHFGRQLSQLSGDPLNGPNN